MQPNVRPASSRASTSINQRHLRIALWIFLTFSVLYVSLTRGHFVTTDEIDVYQATQSLWERGTAAIASPEGVPGRNGHRFPVRNSGLSIAALPFYGFGKAVEGVLRNSGKEDWLKTFSGPVIERAGGDRWGGEAGIFFVNLFNCFAVALVCSLFFLFSLEIGASPRSSFLSTALLGLTSYLAPFSTGFFQHPTEALFLLAAFFFLFLDKREPNWRWRALAGAMAALLIQFRYPAVIALPGLVLYHLAIVWQRRSGKLDLGRIRGIIREIAPFASAVAIGFLLHGADQFAKFGTIRSAGPYATQGFTHPVLLGLYSFLFSPGDSIFLFTPLLVLTPWILRRFFRSYPLETIFVLLQTAVYLVLYSKFQDWHGLWCFGPRYLMALVPLLLLPLGPWLQHGGWSRRLTVALLALAGLWMQVIHFAVNFWSVARQEHYLTFRPRYGFLFDPSSSQIVAHSKALLAWDWRVDPWLVTVYRTFGPGRFMLVATPLALLLAAGLWQLRRKLVEAEVGTEDSNRDGSTANASGEIDEPRGSLEGLVGRVIHARWLRWVGAVLLPGVLLLVYANHFHNSFHFDDAHTIENNAAIRDLRNIPQFFLDARTFSSLPSNQSYRPLLSTLFALDYWLGNDLNPFWFHCSIFALLLGLVALIAFVTCRLLQMSVPSAWNFWIALTAAALYGVHPANADTVNYVIAVSDVVSTFGVVASFAVYLAFPAWRRWYLFVLPAAVCILAKPPTAVFGLLFAFYLLIFPADEGGPKEARPQKRFYNWCRDALPPLLICVAMLIFVQKMTPKTWIAGAANAHNYLITQPYVVLRYVQAFLWPSQLSADYDLEPFTTTLDARFWAGLIFTLGVLGAGIALSLSRRARVIGFGLVWFLVALLPTSLFPLAEVINDHRTFFPYVGLFISLAGAASLWLQRKSDRARWPGTIFAGAVVLILCASGYATFQRNKTWQTEESLWRDVSIKSPRNGRGLMNYGLTLMAKGDYEGALNYFRRAQIFTPQYPFLFVNFAIAEDGLNQPSLAEKYFREALRLAPNLPDTYTFYARFLLAHSRAEEAQPLLRKAAALSPTDQNVRDLIAQSTGSSAEALVNLSLEHYRRGRFAEAIADSQKALDLRPNYAEAWNNIGASYNSLGQFGKGAAACQKALSFRPDFSLARRNLQYAQEMMKKNASAPEKNGR